MVKKVAHFSFHFNYVKRPWTLSLAHTQQRVKNHPKEQMGLLACMCA
jgi:hypothetical protein